MKKVSLLILVVLIGVIGFAFDMTGLVSGQERIDGFQNKRPTVRRTLAPETNLLTEDFNYVGSLTDYFWVAHSGGTTNAIASSGPGLVYDGYIGSNVGNSAMLTNTGQDVHRTFAVQTSGSVYAAAMVNVSEAVDGPSGDYVLHLAPDPIGSAFRGRLYVKRDANFMLAFGISKAANTSAPENIAFTAFAYAMNTTHLVVVKYNVIDGTGNDTIDLFVNPALDGAEPAVTVTAPDTTAGDINPGSIALRQGSASTGPSLRVDGIRVGTSWSDITGSEPPPPTSTVRFFTSSLHGEFEVQPVATTAHGYGTVRLNEAEDEITVNVDWLNLSSATISGHIHGPALPGVNAGVLFDLMPPQDTSGSASNRVFSVTPQQVADLRAGLWYFNIHSQNHQSGEIRGQIMPKTTDAPYDFNGDGRTDYGVIRPTNNPNPNQLRWFTRFSGTSNGGVEIDWGTEFDSITPGDFDGDGADDIAIWRPQTDNSGYYILYSNDFTFEFKRFGLPSDTPFLVADYDGDGKDDPAIYRRGAGANDQSFFWWMASADPIKDAHVPIAWGLGSDFPYLGEFTGDGKADFCVYRNVGGQAVFFIHPNSGGADEIADDFVISFGLFNDTMLPGDYDGDGITDIAMSRVENGSIIWYILPSGGGDMIVQNWGLFGTSLDYEVQGDYDGDGKTDIAVWRPDTPSTFYVMKSTGGVEYFQYGLPEDIPIAWNFF